MPKRITCVPAIFAMLFIALTPRAGGAEPAGDDCVAKPNSAAPQGSHWYYRVDRPANRRCWFLGPPRLKGATGGVTETAAICDVDAAAQFRHPRRSRSQRVGGKRFDVPFPLERRAAVN
jgi:hypothetical protein